MIMKALMCCSNTRPYLEVHPFDLSNSFFRLTDDSFHALNGKIVAECEIEIERIESFVAQGLGSYIMGYQTDTLKFEELVSKIGNDYEKLYNDLKYENGYAIHIKNIQFIEEPYNVNEVWQYKKYNIHLKNAPKNMCAIYGKDGDPYVLITASSEELCRSLNKKQTILIRREIPERVLKWMN